jgi:hypothetical protein
VPRDRDVSEIRQFQRLPNDGLVQCLVDQSRGIRQFDDYTAVFSIQSGVPARVVTRRGARWKIEDCAATARTRADAPVPEDAGQRAAWWAQRRLEYEPRLVAEFDGNRVSGPGATRAAEEPGREADPRGLAAAFLQPEAGLFLVELLAYPPIASAVAVEEGGEKRLLAQARENPDLRTVAFESQTADGKKLVAWSIYPVANHPVLTTSSPLASVLLDPVFGHAARRIEQPFRATDDPQSMFRNPLRPHLLAASIPSLLKAEFQKQKELVTDDGRLIIELGEYRRHPRGFFYPAQIQYRLGENGPAVTMSCFVDFAPAR